MIAAYTEAGNMLRHYSVCRTAVLSIAFPICFVILGWVLTSNQENPLPIYIFVAEAILFCYASCLSIFFSIKYEQTRKLLVRIEAGQEVFVYSSMVSSILRSSLKLDAIDKTLLVVGVLIHIAYLAYYFLNNGPVP